MFIGKITNKETLADGRLNITVSFTDGVDTEVRTVIPQDKAGFEHWVLSVAQSLTTSKELKDEDNIGVDVVKTVVADERTATEKDRDVWLRKYNTWVSVKANLIDTGVLTGNETKITAYLADVKATFKPDYINFI